MEKLQNPVLLAVIGAAHGIRGEVRVKSFTGEPTAIRDYGTLFDKNGRAFEIESLRPQQEVVVVRFRNIADRNEAETLNGTELFVDRSMLPPAGDDEFYHDDLVGLAVRGEHDAEIGRVTAVHNFGGGDVLELNFQGRGGTLIPFTRAAVPEISITEGHIRIDVLAAGLVEPDESADEELSHQGFDPRRRNRGPRDAGGNR